MVVNAERLRGWVHAAGSFSDDAMVVTRKV